MTQTRISSYLLIATWLLRVSLGIGVAGGVLESSGSRILEFLVKTGIVWLNMATSVLPEHGHPERFYFFTLFWKNRCQTATHTES